MNEEIWKEIEGYEGLYSVSNMGNIRSEDRKNNGKILSPSYTQKRYYYVYLHKNGLKKKKRIHQIVADAFLPKKEGTQVDHINNIKTDNRVVNLRRVTASENKFNSVGVKGIYKIKSGKYSVQIWVNTKHITVGSYLTYEEALFKRKEAEQKYYPNIKAQ